MCPFPKAVHDFRSRFFAVGRKEIFFFFFLEIPFLFLHSNRPVRVGSGMGGMVTQVGICTVSWVDMGGGDITIYKHFQCGTVQHTTVTGRSDRCVPRTLRAEYSAVRYNSIQGVGWR
jgi:hypothetical protein